jgi:3-deoxy-D-manno-octulosonate cytidylyltransferase
MATKTLIVIPARYGSTRLLAKPLVHIAGKPMIQWVYEKAIQVQSASEVIVATDHPDIFSTVEAFGGKAMMTDPQIQSGTDRVGAVAQQIQADIVVNLQGDEPLIEPAGIEKAIQLVATKAFPIATLMSALESFEELQNPNVVKVLPDSQNRAIYFSRLPIPYSRVNPLQEGIQLNQLLCRKHIGLYVFERQCLETFIRLPASKLEKAESLEQLRALWHGMTIGVAEVDFPSIGVDTQEDLAKLEILICQNKRNTSL